MNEHLNKLLRRNKGKALLSSYESLFIDSGFKKEDLHHIDLDTSDEIIQQIRKLGPELKYENELISGDVENFHHSGLLRSMYDKYKESDCYVYTDAHVYCGMYDICVKTAFKFSLIIALKDVQHTCFLIDKKFRYTFTINYYSSDQRDDPNKFDIQRRLAPSGS